jgi:hypothetical protein
MPFYELVFETGSSAVATYADDDEMLSAVKAHHGRAMSGEVGGPTGHPAERVVEVQKYNEHPGTLNEGQVLSADVAKKELEAAMKGLTDAGTISVTELAAAVRDLSNPLVAEPDRHGSKFKMEAVETFTADKWEGK